MEGKRELLSMNKLSENGKLLQNLHLLLGLDGVEARVDRPHPDRQGHVQGGRQREGAEDGGDG